MPRLAALTLIMLFTFSRSYSQNIDSLEAVVASGKIDSGYVTALSHLAEYYRTKEPEKGISYAERIIQHPEINPKLTASSYLMIALILTDRNKYDSASLLFAEAKKIADQNPHNKGILSILYNGLGLFHKKQGQNERALRYYISNDSLGEAAMGKENAAGNQLNIANTYNRMGNRREAIRYLYKALSNFEAIEHNKGMSYCYNNLGILLKQQQNLEQAEFYLKKSYSIKEKLGDVKGLANSANELALLYIELSNLDEATRYVDQTIELSRKLGLQEMLATGLVNKGKVLRIEDKFKEALSILAEARPIADALPNHYVLSQLHSEMGKLLTETKHNAEAIEVLLSGIKEAENSSNVEALPNGHLFISQAYTRNRQYKEALEHFQKYYYLEDSIRGKKLKLDYKALETQYELEKKNTEIALLKKDQELHAKTTQRQQAIQTLIGLALVSVIIIAGLLINRYRIINRTKRLLEIERVRNTIARDLHDDIGSTMSSINIVSQMALQQNNSNGAPENHFRKIADQSSALMERMSDIVWSINPANDSLPMMVAKMKEFTAEILEPKNIQYTFSGVETLNGEVLEVEKRKNIFLIFKEAINNAAKYSDGTNVDIRFTQKQKTLLLEISDNGRGFDFKAGKKGNGLRNMHERAKSINASMDIDTAEAQGTRLAFHIPLT